MEPRKDNNIEHRRAQNRIAQRRFRQRKSQQKSIGAIAAEQLKNSPRTLINDPRLRVSSGTRVQQDLPLTPSDTESLEIFTSSSGSSGAVTTSRTASHSAAAIEYDFGVECLQGRKNGPLGIQSFFLNMDNLDSYAIELDSHFSNPLSAPSLSRSETVSVERIFGSRRLGHRSSSPKTRCSLESMGGSCSSHGSLSESIEDTCAPIPNILTPIYIEKGKNVESGSGWLSPLHIAAKKGHNRIARVLLQYNIDPNEVDSDGLTPLIHATVGGYEDILTSLLSHGAHIDKVDTQHRTALHWAVIHKREVLLKILLDYCMGNQSLVDCYDIDGVTPLHTAIDTGFEAGVEVLLEYGANVHYRVRKK